MVSEHQNFVCVIEGVKVTVRCDRVVPNLLPKMRTREVVDLAISVGCAVTDGCTASMVATCFSETTPRTATAPSSGPACASDKLPTCTIIFVDVTLEIVLAISGPEEVK